MTHLLQELDEKRSSPKSTRRRMREFLPSWPGHSWSRWIWALLALVVTLASLFVAGVGQQALVKPEGAGLFGEFFAAALRPRLDGEFLALTAISAVTTLAYAVLGAALSLVIGLLGGILMSEVWWFSGAVGRRRRMAWVGWLATRVILVVPRGIHEVVWGLFFLLVFGINPIVAVLAIGIPFGAVAAKVFSELLDEASHEPYRALICAGSRRRAAVVYGLLPIAFTDLLSYSFYRFECAIRSATILGLVGAGGIGFQLALSYQALRYEEIWTLLYAVIFLSAGADLWSSAVRARRAHPRTRLVYGGRRRDRVLVGSLAAVGLMVPFSMWWISLDISVLWTGSVWKHTRDVLAAVWPLGLGPDGIMGLLKVSGVTLAMSVLAIMIAFLGGALFAFPAANLAKLGRRRGTRVSRGLQLVLVATSRGLLIVLRAIPPPVWALLFLFVLFPGVLPGALALGVYTVGVLGRLMAETTENLDRRPLDALRVRGVPERQVLCYGVIPSATPRFVAYGLYRWEVSIRETVVVGVVGAGGLGLMLDQQLAAFDFGGAVVTLITLIALTLVVDFTSAAARRSLR